MFKLTILITALWLPVMLYRYEEAGSFYFWRYQLILLTGILAISYMGVASLLAVRFQWTEKLVNGLDKGYAIHKKLGIGAAVVLIAHWLMVKSAKWLVEAGWLEPRAHHKHVVEGINWHGLARDTGEMAFYVLLVFVVISLVSLITYRQFKYIHKIAGLLMIAGAFHSVIFLHWDPQWMGYSIFTVLISLVGVGCALLSLSGKIGQRRKVRGQVIAVERYGPENGGREKPAYQVARFSICLEKPLQYREGQFCYLNFHDGESPHPFSVLNYDIRTKKIDFAVKALGDYTHKLVHQLASGQYVTVEGGYGHFQIPETKNQVWIGAGIGIVPFISRLYWLNHQARKQASSELIHLFYCVQSEKEAFFLQEIRGLIEKFNWIELHLFNAEKGELLSVEDISQKMAGKQFEVSFCGPESFARQLEKTLKHSGLAVDGFQRELFKMR